MIWYLCIHCDAMSYLVLDITLYNNDDLENNRHTATVNIILCCQTYYIAFLHTMS